MSPPLPPLDPSATPRRAWSWVAALQAGTTTTWPAWRDEERVADAASATLPYLPGAQQLELLRRTNLAAHQRGETVPPELAARILRAGSTDRGRGDLPLLTDSPPPFGPPAVDPTGLPATELLRVAAGLIAEDLATSSATPTGPSSTDSRRRSRCEVGGDPWAIYFATDDGWSRWRWRRPIGLILGADLATLAAHAWAARCLDGAGTDLTGWLAERCDAQRLPRVLDLAAAAQGMAQRLGAGHTTLVLDLERTPRRRSTIELPDVGLDDVELVRRVGRALALLVPAERRRRALAGLLYDRARSRAVNQTRTESTAWSVPEPFLGVLREHGERQVAALRRHRYPVVGRVSDVVAAASKDAAEPVPERVLAIAIDRLLARPHRPLDPQQPRPIPEETT